MADYTRFVSYMYSYDNGVKMNNVGFAKLEERNGQLKVTLNLKNITSTNNEPYKIYLFYRNDGNTEGICLGNLNIKNGLGEFRTTTNSNNIMNSSKAFKNCGGIIIDNKSTKAYATEWDDIPINFSKFNANNAETINEPAIQAETPVSKQTDTVIIEEDIAENIPSKPTLSEDVQSDVNPLEIETMESVDNVNFTESTFLDEGKINSDDLEDGLNPYDSNTRVIQSLHNYEPFTGYNSYDYTNDSYTNAGNEEIIYETNLQTNFSESSPGIENLFKSFPKMFPFADDSVIECVRIEPQDIGSLPMPLWVLGNNSFLLHSYYNYRHLILSKMKSPDNKIVYIIGVPGIYHNREKFMAKMFGFDEFKPVNRKEQLTGEFGYWYMTIDPE